MNERIFTVQGMTCEHCVRSVTEEVGAVEGVAGVHVDLPTGSVTVRGDAFTDADVAEAVDDAGYEVVEA